MRRPTLDGLPVKRFYSARAEAVLDGGPHGERVRKLTRHELHCLCRHWGALDVQAKEGAA